MGYNNIKIAILLFLGSMGSLISCNDLEVEKSDSLGVGFIQLNDTKIAIDFVSINGPYLTFGCSNAVTLRVLYGNTTENLDRVYLPSPRFENGIEGTFSGVRIKLNDNPYCEGNFGQIIHEDSYLEARNLGDGKFQFAGIIKVNHCKEIKVSIEYTGGIYYESEDCYGCARPCSIKDNSYLNQEPSTQVLKIKGQNYNRLYSYNDEGKLASIKLDPMSFSTFKYNNNLLIWYNYFSGETIGYNVQNEDGKIKRIAKSDAYSPYTGVTYFIYQNGLIVQSIDSVYGTETYPVEQQLLGTTQYEYNESGNLITQTIIRDDEITAEIHYQYDDKINPFYQMYHSWVTSFSPITSPNNVIKILSTNNKNPAWNYTTEFKFTYDSRGYPISIATDGQAEREIEYLNYDF